MAGKTETSVVITGSAAELDKAFAQSVKEMEAAEKAAAALEKQLKKQAEAFGLSGRAAKIQQAAQGGASTAALAGARAADAQLRGLERGKAAKEAALSAGGALFGQAAAAISQSLSGEKSARVGDVVSGLSGIVGAIPGPVGQIGSVLTSAVGGILNALMAASDRMRERVQGSFGAILSGSQTVHQAIASIHTDTLAGELGRIGPEGGGTSFIRSMIPGMGRSATTAESIEDAVATARHTQANLRAMLADPNMQGLIRTVSGERAQQRATDSASAAYAAAGASGQQLESLRGGASDQEAADAAQRHRMTLELAQRIQMEGESFAGAFGRARDSLFTRLNVMAAGQAMARGMATGAAVAAATRTPLEALQAEMRRLDEAAAAGVDPEVVARGRAAAVNAAERAVGDAPVGQAALMEGSAAAASAILKAQREQQRDNPTARLERIQLDMLEQSRGMAEAVRQLNAGLAAGRYFRRVDIGGGIF